MSGLHRYSQRKGAHGEQAAEMALKTRGVRMLHKIATPIKIVGTKKLGGQPWHRVVFSEKPPGDWGGILPDGRRVLAEVKTRGERLLWSDLKPHQRTALTTNHKLGGVSLLVWVTDYSDVYVMRWPVPGLAPRKSIDRQQAAGLEWWAEENGRE